MGYLLFVKAEAIILEYLITCSSVNSKAMIRSGRSLDLLSSGVFDH